MRQTHVLIIGAGVAGCVAALRLTPRFRVTLLEKAPASGEGFRIGESLPAAARRLLRDLGLWEDFQAEPHRPCIGNQSRWGNDHLQTVDDFQNLDGHGWHLDRVRFDAWLRDHALASGASIRTISRLSALDFGEEGWDVQFEDGEGEARTLNADWLIDAAGRGSPVRHLHRIRRRHSDKLVCLWTTGTERESTSFSGFSSVQSEARGWWYSASVPNGTRVLAFYTDLPEAIHADGGLLSQALRTPHLGQLLETVDFCQDRPERCCDAHSGVLETFGGERWLSAGDAAMSFDPISSQGLFNAMYCGFTAAGAIARAEEGSAAAIPAYVARLTEIHTRYERHRLHCYRSEARWSEEEFWQRRR